MPSEIDRSAEHALEKLHGIASTAAAKVLRRSSGVEVEDVAQTAIADYLEYAAKNEVEKPGALVAVFAKYRAIKHLNRWVKRRTHLQVDHIGRPDEDHAGAVVDLPSTATSPSAAHANKAKKARVAAAIEQLDAVDQEIARLTYHTEPPLTAPEVAKHVGLTAGTVRNHLVAIRRTLAGLLDEEVG